jgi:flagellar biogenesis protein FliO
MLGTRERIALVEFEGRRLLVGVTPAQITLLCELDRDPKRFSMVQGAAPGGDGNASV